LWIGADFISFSENDLFILLKKDERFLVLDEFCFSTRIYINRKIKNKSYEYYCWCCKELRSDHDFSEKNKSDQLCKDCSKLSSEDLKYRQTIRNIDRLLGFGDLISPRNKKALENYLGNEDLRICEYVKMALVKGKDYRLQNKTSPFSSCD